MAEKTVMSMSRTFLVKPAENGKTNYKWWTDRQSNSYKKKTKEQEVHLTEATTINVMWKNTYWYKIRRSTQTKTYKPEAHTNKSEQPKNCRAA